jgi:hypothetical protein
VGYAVMDITLVESVIARAEEELVAVKKAGDMALAFRIQNEINNLYLQLIILEEIKHVYDK